jgi:hypothetical protein
MMKEIRGVCFLHSETGTDGGWWAVQEDGFVNEDGGWRYEGMQYLEEGDDFTVFDDDGSVIWHGVILQDCKTGAVPHRVIHKGKVVTDRSWKQQVVGGMWVHWVEQRMDPEDWGELFFGEKRCVLKREQKTPPR